MLLLRIKSKDFLSIKFEEILEKGRVDMMLEEGENWARSMLYSKRLSQLKSKGSEEKEIKTRENPLFTQFNTTGVDKIKQNKEAVRPITASSKYSVFSTRNATTRGSSRPSKRAESAFTRRKESERSRLFSAKPQSDFEFKATTNTQSQTALNVDEKARQEFYSKVITPSEQQSLTKENK